MKALPQIAEVNTTEYRSQDGSSVTERAAEIMRNRMNASQRHMAKHYALIETGHGAHYWGVPKRNALSEASNIPVIVLGELVDPEGRGKANYEEIYVRNPTWVNDLKEDHPWYGWSYEQVGSMMDAIQIQAERINIRLILVWDPESKGRDESYRDVMREVIAMISAEQEIDYADVPVRMLKELAEPQINCLTADHVTELLSIE